VAKTVNIEDLVQPILQPGELLLGTTRVNYNGTVPPNLFILETKLAAINDGEQLPLPDPDVTVAFPTASQMAMALTRGRLFLWSLGLSGKPKHYIGEVPLSAIARVRGGGQGFGSELHLTMKSGALVDLEFMRGESADEFMAQVSSLVG
jgi:hypothetical protein